MNEKSCEQNLVERKINKLDLIRHGDKLGDPKFRSSQGKDKFGWNKDTLNICILTRNTHVIILIIKLSHISHFKISTRNYARDERAARAVVGSKLTGRYYLSSYLPIINLTFIMKIRSVMCFHKMASWLRHGWVIRLKTLLDRFLIREKILWKFEDDCSIRFWDILNTKFIQK